MTATHSLMVQGTTSDAGKSILVTALCRILKRHGFEVAPFKPQNMALNSAVAIDGGEIGRAQALQAEACSLAPSVLMNPVLIKPTSQMGSQIIVQGKAIGNMQAAQYHEYKPELLHTVVDTFKQLQAKHTHIVIEGAGSPAEINLRERDIANMGFAEAIDCPVIIVADIDRGGVFAHLYGTYALLSESEQARVKGFVINRFRGDPKLLDSGLTWLKEKTSVPVLAVIPYIENLYLDAEDSLSAAKQQQQLEQSAMNIVVIQLPKISNQTDFDALRMHPQVNCQSLREVSDFAGADVIIIPGSKSVMSDLQWLKEQGWDELINKHLRFGGKVLGICGGFQMLGHKILDPEQIESDVLVADGLSLLEMSTTLKPNKILRNVSGTFVSSETKIAGYEVHTGVSDGEALERPLLALQNEQGDSFVDGAIAENGQIAGTYLHGLFDQQEALSHWLSWAGLSSVDTFDYAQFREAQIEHLADVVEQHLSIDVIKQLIGITP